MKSVLGLERAVNVSAGCNRRCATERPSLPGARCRPPKVFEDALAGVAGEPGTRLHAVIGADRAGEAGPLRGNGADMVVTDPAELMEAR